MHTRQLLIHYGALDLNLVSYAGFEKHLIIIKKPQIIESLRLAKTFEISKSNGQPSPPVFTVKPRPQCHFHRLLTLPAMGTSPFPWETVLILNAWIQRTGNQPFLTLVISPSSYSQRQNFRLPRSHARSDFN